MRQRRGQAIIRVVICYLWLLSAVAIVVAFIPQPISTPKSSIISGTKTFASFQSLNANPNNNHNLNQHSHRHSRNIIILSHNVTQDVADGYFDVNTLLTGRIDVLARCVNSALWISNAIRQDTTVYLMLFPHNITIEVRGDAVESLNPDERTMALHLQRTLLAGNTVNSTHFKLLESNSSLLRENGGPPDTYNPNKPGAYTKSQKASFRIARRHREAMIRRVYRMVNETGEPSGFMLHRNDTLQKRLRMLKSREEQEGGIDMTSCNTFMLDEMGDPLVHVLPSNNNDESKSSAKATTNIILGDQMGYSPDDEMLLSENKDVKKVSLGPISLLTSHCITIVHNCLDIQQWNN